MTAAPTGSAFLQLLVAGIGTGSIYALIALGFNVVFKSTGAMNFAQGEWVVMGGMISALLLGSFSSVGVACLFAVLFVAIFGLLSERLVIWPLRQPTPLLITLVSIGLSICTRSLVMLVLGKKPVGYRGFSDTATTSFGGVTFQAQTLWIVGLTLAFLVIMHLFFERSMLGKADIGLLRPGRDVWLQGLQRRHARGIRQLARCRCRWTGSRSAGSFRQLLHFVGFQGCHCLRGSAADFVRTPLGAPRPCRCRQGLTP